MAARKPIRARREHPPAVGATHRQKTPHVTCLADQGTCCATEDSAVHGSPTGQPTHIAPPCNAKRDPAHRDQHTERACSMFACRDFGPFLATALPMRLKPCFAICASPTGFWPPHTGNVSSSFVLDSSIVYWSGIGALVASGACVHFPNTQTKALMPVKKQLTPILDHLIRLGPNNFLMHYWNRLTKRCPRTSCGDRLALVVVANLPAPSKHQAAALHPIGANGGTI